MIVIMNQEKNVLAKVDFVRVDLRNGKVIVATQDGDYDVLSIGYYETEERAMDVLQEIRTCIQRKCPTYDMPEQ